jgi:hypothetical protein
MTRFEEWDALEKQRIRMILYDTAQKYTAEERPYVYRMYLETLSELIDQDTDSDCESRELVESIECICNKIRNCLLNRLNGTCGVI